MGQYGEPSQKVLLLQCIGSVVSKINYLIVRGYDRLYFSLCLNHFLHAPFSSFISLYYEESVERQKAFFAWLQGSKTARGVM